MKPKVSIIIVNWNGKQYLNDCLTPLFKQSYENFEVILVDNGSTDGSIDFIKDNFPDVKVIVLNRNCGFAKGNNIGIEEALKDKDTKYIATLNNDTKVNKNWLQELVKVAENDKKIGSCQSKILFLDNPRIIDAVGIGIKRNGSAYQIGCQEEDNRQYENISDVFGACAGAALYRQKALTQIGLFDEDFFAYFEDVDLALRIRLADWKCMYVPKAVVYHKHSATYGKNSPFILYLNVKNKYYYIIKTLPIDIVFKFLISRPIVIVVRILRYIKNKKFSWIKFCLKANLEALKSIPKMFLKRKKIRSVRLISDKELRRWLK